MDLQTKEFLETGGYTMPEKVSLNHPKIKLALDLIKEELEETIAAYEAGDLIEFLDGLVDLSVVHSNATFFTGVNLELWTKLKQEVYESNMSKFDSFLSDAVVSQNEYYKKGVNTYTDKINSKYVTKRSEDGKILKSHKFKKPNLAQFINGK